MQNRGLLMNHTLRLILLLMFVVRAPTQESKPPQQTAGAQNASRTRSSSSGGTLTPSQIFSRALSSVVVIVASDQEGQREALGSGFIVSHGRIATNHHVVEGMNEAFVVFSDGSVKPVATVVADSAQQDLIILTVETGNRSALVLGDELSLQQGDPVYALGAPKGLELSFTSGIVSSFRKSDAQFLIQTTAPIAPGSSGGPLFDRTGRVVGVTTSLLSDAPGIYFSVGVGDLRRLLRTPEAVALPFDEWAKEQDSRPPSRSPKKSAPNQGPSLQDTISWMQSFSQQHGFHRSVPSQTSIFTSERITRTVLSPDPDHDKESAPGCAVYVARDYAGGLEGLMTAWVEIFYLSDIDPDSVRTDKSAVIFDTSNSVAKIQSKITSDPSMTSWKLLSPDYLIYPRQNDFFSVGRIDLDSPESSQRFANALKHAVILCGGTKGTF